ncbi:MAG TPA: protein kinase, partial [Pyrinomonadaceae bacterium]|nr:protein kinase [Pyrinomonadaceae bacterium]
MTPERWQQIEELFHSALEHAPDSRTSFLNDACRGDDELRSRIDALLAAHESAGAFIEEPPMGGVLLAIANQPAGDTSHAKDLLIGRSIGHYEIQSLLGAGGMGEVYLATDVKLDRPVALKILPSQFTADLTQVRRFEREARAASALNNPNIITIYEIGQDGDLHFFATEFIEGQTLRQEISNGRLPITKVIDLTTQIAKALSAAHASGIIHRDIKPENVMVRPDGLVKVLDFGLAKPGGCSPAPDGTNTPSAVSLQTDAVMLMGTVSYLSPEQVRREKVDHRTDIFSLGVVLYEMLAGERPFKGDSMTKVLDAILQSEPEPIAAGLFSDELNRILISALAKDPDARYQTAEEMRRDLARIGQRAGDSRARVWVSRAAVIAMLALPLAFGVWLWRARRTSPPARFGFSTVAQKLTDLPGEEIYPSLSPDGQNFVFASPQNGNWDIYLQGIRDRAATNLTAGADSYDVQPVYSPDGARIAFRSSRNGGGLFVMKKDGTNVTQLTTDGFNPTWSADGRELAFNDDNPFNYEGRNTYPSASKLWAIDLTSGARRVITTHDAVQSNWSPHGQRLAFWGEQKGGHRDIWTIAADGGSEPVPVTDDGFIDWNPVWSPDGEYLYFLSNRG